MSYDITLLPGDGIGPEITEATLKIIEATGIQIKWHRALAGQLAIDAHGSPLPDQTLELIEKTQIGLKGPIGTPIAKGFGSVNVLMRKKFDLYANLRPVKSLKGFKTKFDNIDLVIVRENTEDLYAGIEREVSPGVVEGVKLITKKACDRIAEFAFSYAEKNNRKKVAAVHKANIMKLADGLFLNSTREKAAAHSSIEYKEVIVDNACMQLVMNPYQFDVMVMENLYGDILSDLCSGLVGGLGVVPGANIGEKTAIFEAVHGNAPDIAGKGIANPIALTLSAAMMLRHLGEEAKAQAVEHGVHEVSAHPEFLTPDMGGKANTTQLAEAIAGIVKKNI